MYLHKAAFILSFCQALWICRPLVRTRLCDFEVVFAYEPSYKLCNKCRLVKFGITYTVFVTIVNDHCERCELSIIFIITYAGYPGLEYNKCVGK